MMEGDPLIDATPVRSGVLTHVGQDSAPDRADPFQFFITL